MSKSIYLQASRCCMCEGDIILWARDLASVRALAPCPSFTTCPSLPLVVVPGLTLVPWKLMGVRLFEVNEMRICHSLPLVIFWLPCETALLRACGVFCFGVF